MTPTELMFEQARAIHEQWLVNLLNAEIAKAEHIAQAMDLVAPADGWLVRYTNPADHDPACTLPVDHYGMCEDRRDDAHERGETL